MGLIDLIRRYATVKVSADINKGHVYVEPIREDPKYNYLVDALEIATRECANNLARQYPIGNIKLTTKMKVKIR